MRTLILLFPIFLSQCAAPLLNSERIERRFGNYHIALLSQTDTLRVSNLYSIENGIATTRTLAYVRFNHPRPSSEIASLHQEILDGASLGATFKKAGWTITKDSHGFGESELTGASPSDQTMARLMRLDLPVRLAVHTYQLVLGNGDQRIPYATLTEVHHPDYLSLRDLKQIYRCPESSG